MQRVIAVLVPALTAWLGLLQREVTTMDLTCDHLNSDELRGTTQTDFLVALDGHFRIHDGDVTIYDEPGFPVVELARSLLIWLRARTPATPRVCSALSEFHSHIVRWLIPHVAPPRVG